MKGKWFAAILFGVSAIAVLLVTAKSLYDKVDPTGLAIAATIAVGALILLLSRIERKASSAGQADASRPTAPSAISLSYSDGQRFLIVMGFVCYAIALVAWISGDLPRDGRWGWLIGFFYNWLGAAGPSVLFAVLGTVLLCLATMQRGKSN
jgi:hypothetical protein